MVTTKGKTEIFEIQGLFDSANLLKSMFGNVTDVGKIRDEIDHYDPEHPSPFIERLNSLVNEVASNAGNAAAKGATEQVKQSLFDVFGEKTTMLLDILSISCIIAGVVGTMCREPVPKHVVAASVLYQCYRRGPAILSKCGNFFTKGVFEPQGFDIEQIADIFTTGFAFSNMYTSKNPTFLRKFSDGINRCKNVRGDVATLISSVVTLLSDLVTWVAEKCGFAYKCKILSGDSPEIDEWSEQVKQIYELCKTNRLPLTKNTSITLSRLEKKGYELFTRHRAMAEYNMVRNEIKPILEVIHRMMNELEKRGIFGTGNRMEPAVVCIRGESGVGKTFMTGPFVHSVISRCLPKDQLELYTANHDSFVYPLFSENKYWDAYQQQFAVVIDDAFQARDTVGEPDNEYLKLIRMGGCFQYTTHMADIESKGKNYFSSELVFVSTNSFSIRPMSIISSEAVNRRLTLDYVLIPKTEFCTDSTQLAPLKGRRLDCSKIDNTKFNPSIYELHAWDSTKDNFKGEKPISYSELVEKTVALHKSRKTQAGANETNIRETILEGLSVRGDVDVCEKEKLTKDWIAQSGNVELLYDLQCEQDPPNSRCEEEEPDQNFYEFLPESVQKFIENKKIEQNVELMEKFWKSMEDESFVEEVFSKDANRQKAFLEIYFAAEMARFKGGFDFPASILYKMDVQLARARNKLKNLWGKLRAGISPKMLSYVKAAGLVLAGGTAITILIRGLYCAVKEIGLYFVRFFFPDYGKNDIVPQFGDINLSHIIVKVNRKSVYDILVDGNNIGRATFVKEKMAILPYHFYDFFLKHRDKKIQFRSLDNSRSFEFDFFDEQEVQYRRIEDRDLLLIRFVGDICQNHPDITGLFPSRSEVASKDKMDGVIGLKHFDHEMLHRVKIIVGGGVKYEYEGTKFNDAHLLQYEAPTQKGDCGVLVFRFQPSATQGKIIGFHVAGDNSGRGVATCLFKEDFETTWEPQIMDIEIKTFKVYKKLNRTSSTFQQSKIIRSKLYNSWGAAKCKPAYLRPFEINGVRIDPWHVALKRYDTVCTDLEERMSQAVVDATFADLLRFPPHFEWKRVLTYREAICGVDGVDFIDAVNRSTSPGYPYNQEKHPGFEGKEWFFGKDDQFDLERVQCKKLLRDCEEYEDKLRNNIRMDIFYMGALKDERKPIDKVDLGKTRYFSGAPLHYTIVFNRYFKCFAKYIMDNRIVNGCAAGVNVYSHEWHEIYRCLSKFGPNCVAGDFSGFDTRQVPRLLKKFVDHINQWYDDGPINARIRVGLWKEVFNSRHVIGNNVFEWTQSLPSGHPLTTIINCIYQHCVVRYVWILAHDSDLKSLLDFRKHVELMVYGDDGVLALSEYAKVFFNQKELTRLFLEIGMVYTSEDKVSDVAPVRPIEEVSFLKREFRYDAIRGRALSPLSLDTILEMPYWTKRGQESEEITCNNVAKALYELSQHDNLVFEKYARKILRSSRERLDFAPVHQSYEVCQEVVTSWHDYKF